MGTRYTKAIQWNKLVCIRFDSGLNIAYKSVVCFSHSVVGDCSSLSLLWNNFVFSHPSNCLVYLLIPNSFAKALSSCSKHRQTPALYSSSHKL